MAPRMNYPIAPLFRFMCMTIAMAIGAACGTETGPENMPETRDSSSDQQKRSSTEMPEGAKTTYSVQIDPQLWGQQTKLMASDGMVADFFGHSVSLSGDTALVGAYDHAVGGMRNRGRRTSSFVAGRHGRSRPNSWRAMARRTIGSASR